MIIFFSFLSLWILYLIRITYLFTLHSAASIAIVIVDLCVRVNFSILFFVLW